MLIPVVVFGVMVILAFNYFNGPGNGTLIIEAQSQGTGGGASQLYVAVTVNGVTYLTPHNVTLPQGPYTVDFPSASWYTSPAPRTINVLGGRTAYAIGVYVPNTVVVGVSKGGINVTQPS